MPSRANSPIRQLGVVALPLAFSACTSFASLRSAEVTPGPSLLVQASIASPPGDDAAWFWAYDCAFQCNHAIAAADINLGFGFVPPSGPSGTASFGLSGTYPYVDGYVQLGRRERQAAGIGLRAGIPLQSWNEYAAYGRIDRPLGRRARLLLNPTIFYHTGTSPNGANPGSFLGLAQGIGALVEGAQASFIPGLTLVLGRVDRSSYGQTSASSWTLFTIISVAVVFHRRPQA